MCHLRVSKISDYIYEVKHLKNLLKMGGNKHFDAVSISEVVK